MLKTSTSVERRCGGEESVVVWGTEGRREEKGRTLLDSRVGGELVGSDGDSDGSLHEGVGELTNGLGPGGGDWMVGQRNEDQV